MRKFLKQSVGIDVAQKELVVSLGRLSEDLTAETYAFKTFPNTSKGFMTLITWVKKLTDPETSIHFVMEATGVYHEGLAYFLEEKGHDLTIVLPNKISNYFRTLEIKTITDKSMSEVIARFGLERKLEKWKKPKRVFKSLKQLTRERDQLVEERTMVKNHLHAEMAEAQPHPESLQRMRHRILFINKQHKEVVNAIKDLVKKDENVANTVKKLTSITGIGDLTAVTVLAETNGFELIRNKRQLTSYAGLDVREKQSGTSVKGKPKISKKGNRFLRKAMHLPALAAIRHDERFKAIFHRLISKHGIKMKAVVAVQRKLLEMCYTIFKSGENYNREYLSEKQVFDKKLERS
jgi:transposase